ASPPSGGPAMAMDELALERAARAAYERGRMRAALPALAAVVALVAVSLSGCGAPSFTLTDGAALAALATWLLVRGGALARGVRPGLLAGAVPFAAPLIAHAAFVHAGDPAAACGPVAAAICAGAGLASGVALGAWLARRGATLPLATLASAAVIASLTG